MNGPKYFARRSNFTYVFSGAVLVLILLIAAGTGDSRPISAGAFLAGLQKSPAMPERLSYRLVKTHPHDSKAFTQGLVFRDGFLYEGTGQYGSSALRKLDLETGRVVKEKALSRQYFGEGIAILGDRIYQLTWYAAKVFVYDLDSFELLHTLRYPIAVEGWGLTTDGRDLIMGDGSSELFYFDPGTFALKKRLKVTLNDSPVTNINELEYVDGVIYANVWQTDFIIRTDPRSGKVTGVADLRELAPVQYRGHVDYVLNGIAYDPGSGHLLVTGKMWPQLFEIELQ